MRDHSRTFRALILMPLLYLGFFLFFGLVFVVVASADLCGIGRNDPRRPPPDLTDF